MSGEAQQSGLLSFTVKVGNNSVDHTTYPILSIVIDKTVNKIPYARILVHDGDPSQQDFPIINSSIFTIGGEIAIQAGYGGEEQPIFKGIITRQAIQARRHATSVLIVDCRDAAYKTTLLPKNASFGGVENSVTDSKVLTDIIGEYSDLSIEAEATSVQHETLLQPGITDWDLMLLRAEANGQVVIVDDGKINVAKPKIKQSPTASFTYGVNMSAFEAEMDVRKQWQGAAGRVWEHTKQASEDIKVAEPGESSFGDVDASKLSSVNKQTPTVFYHSGELAEQEMETLAQSLLTRSRLSKIMGKITVQGIATLKPGQIVKIEKGAKSFQGNAYVMGVRQEIVEGDWVTHLTLGLPNQRHKRKYSDVAALPAAGMLPPIHGLQIGVVKKIVEDPKTAYRIFVRLPMIHKSDEGIWCRIASFYAFQEVGAFFMPEIGSEVVLGSIDGDPRSLVILGCLYSATNKPAVEIDENNSTKSITSKSKLTLTFNDEDEEIILNIPGDEERTVRISNKDSTIEIINGQANKVLLGKKDVEIFSNQDITLSADRSININAGDSIALTGSSAVNIDGNNVTVSADMKASVSGKSSTELTSNATTIVKGSKVKIN